MNLQILSRVSKIRYSSVAATEPDESTTGDRLIVDVSRQIPRRPAGVGYGATHSNPVDMVRPGAPAFLLLHGDDDRIIPPAQTLALHEALLAAGADSTRYLLAGAGHGRLALSRTQARQWTSVQVMTIIKDFLDGHLKS